MLSLLIIIPLLIVILLNLGPKSIARRLAFWIAVMLPLLQACSVIFCKGDFWNSSVPVVSQFMRWDLAIDALSLVMLLSIAGVVFVGVCVGRSLIKDAAEQFNFLNLVLISLGGMNGIVLVRDIFSLYVFLEVTAVSSFILIAFQKEKDSFEGAFKYLLFSAIATVLMLSSIALFVLVSGGTSFAGISSALRNSAGTAILVFAAGIFICGFFIKSGLMPFHGWLPDAYMIADAPVSVLLAGIVTKTVGVYSLLRIVHSVFGFEFHSRNILMFVGALSIIGGAFAALAQKDLKRMLAYSSISQVGYIILSFGCGTALGIAGAVFHLFNHAAFKSLLFVNAAAVESRTGTRSMEAVSGLASRMPITNLSSIIAGLSIAGIPPLSGFWSKLLMVVALWTAGYRSYAVIAVLVSVVTLAYMLMLQRKVFWGSLPDVWKNVKEAELGVVLPEVVLALVIIGVGLCFPLLANTFLVPVNLSAMSSIQIFK